ncbi:peptide deformylase [Rickettsiales bacterium LUAb2]
MNSNKLISQELPVILFPEQVLKQRAIEITDITAETKQLAANMLQTMYNYGGIGIAANQVDILQRIMVIDLGNTISRNNNDSASEEKTSEHENNKKAKEQKITPNPIVFINPEIIEESDELFDFEEGCLSIPKARGIISRPKKIKVSYLDLEGNPQILEAEELLSTCIQHEIDHLNGVLFIDHLSILSREKALKQYYDFKNQDILNEADLSK